MNNEVYNIWNNICEYLDHTKINYKNLTTMEKAIISNDIQTLKDGLASGKRIYANNILCNGYYNRIHNVHPNSCHGFICNKTLVYYALWMNCYYYSLIFCDIISLLSLLEKSDLYESLKKIYDVIVLIESSHDIVLKFSSFYDHKTTYFKKVNDILEKSQLIVDILDKLEKIYGITEPEFTSGNDPIICHRMKLGINNNENMDSNKISLIVGNMKNIYKKYINNSGIVKILFSQQAFEYYEYHVNIKLFGISDAFNSIMNNPYVDINYCPDPETNIFSMTIEGENNPQLIKKLIDAKALLPHSKNIIDILNKCQKDNIMELFKWYDVKFFGDVNNLITIVLSSDKLMTVDKIEVIEIFMKRNLLDKVPSLIRAFIQSDLSYALIEKISERKQIMEKVTSRDIYSCIKLLKHRELNILLQNSTGLINEQFEGNFPIVHYFRETNNDYPECKLILRTLLTHKVDLTVRNSLGQTPLLIAIINDRIESFEMIYKAGGDPFDKDDDNYNSLHYAIIRNHPTLISLMLDRKITNELSQQSSGGIHPLIMAINCRNPVNIIEILLSDNHIDCNCKTLCGNNILHYLINAKLDLKVKNNLFKQFLAKNIDLFEDSVDNKPLLACAAEKNLYTIMIMIMNKLLELGEIRFTGYENIQDIRSIIYEPVTNIIVKNTSKPNFYSLVMGCLRKWNGIEDDKFVNLSNFLENMFISLSYVILYNYNVILTNKKILCNDNVFLEYDDDNYNVIQEDKLILTQNEA